MIDMKCAECGEDLWTKTEIVVRPHDRKAFCSPTCHDRHIARDGSVVVIAPGPARLGLVSA